EVDGAMSAVQGEVSMNALSSGTLPRNATPLARVFALVAYTDARLMLEHGEALLNLDDPPDWPSCDRALRAIPDPRDHAGRMHVLVKILEPAFSRCLQQGYRLMTERRLAAVAMACRHY